MMRGIFTGSLIVICIILMRVDVIPGEELQLLTMNSFLSTTERDYSLENHQELLDYLETASSSTPYIDKIEFRTTTKDFEIARQKYGLRFYSKGWGETKFNNMLTESIIDAHRVEHEVIYNKALSKRYNLILDYLESVEHLKVMQELQAVYEDRISVLNKQSGTLSFDVGEYITAESRYPEYFTPSWRESYGVGDNYPAYELEWGDAVLYCNASSPDKKSSSSA